LKISSPFAMGVDRCQAEPVTSWWC